MIYRYQFKNFFSFYSQTEVSLAISRHVPQSDAIALSETGARLSKVLAIMGANASGKTNLLKPLAFVHWFINHSFQLSVDDDIPLQAHLLHQTEASEFEIEFDLDGVIWRYELKATSKRVYYEALYKKVVRFNYVFIRQWDNKNKNYIVKLKNFGLGKKEAENVRENASLISTAAQYGVELATQFQSLSFESNVDFVGRSSHSAQSNLPYVASFYKQNQSFKRKMTQLLKSWDFGLSDIEVRQFAIDPEKPSEMIDLLVGVHKSTKGSFELLFHQESSGTQGAIVLLSKILPVLKYGGLAVIDELEGDLHPHMLEPILNLFFNQSTNPENAQIIFTCHAAEVLNLLHKSQVMLVEKDDEHHSQAWKLDEVEGIRADDNLYAKYMAGAYSAIPEI